MELSISWLQPSGAAKAPALRSTPVSNHMYLVSAMLGVWEIGERAILSFSSMLSGLFDSLHCRSQAEFEERSVKGLLVTLKLEMTTIYQEKIMRNCTNIARMKGKELC